LKTLNNTNKCYNKKKTRKKTHENTDDADDADDTDDANDANDVVVVDDDDDDSGGGGEYDAEEVTVEGDKEDEVGDLPTVQIEYEYTDKNQLYQKMSIMNLLPTS
jgi:hypothetical protein